MILIRHLFKNFWKSFTKNTLQVLGLFMMLIVIITIFCGLILSHNLAYSQLDKIGQGSYDTNVTFRISDELKIKSRANNLSYSLVNINYLDDKHNPNLNQMEKANFSLKKINDYYQIILDSKTTHVGQWLASNSNNEYFQQQLKNNDTLAINFRNDILPNSDFILTDDEYNKLISYSKTNGDWMPFVSVDAKTKDLSGYTIFTNQYKDFKANQDYIHELEIKLMNTVILGSVINKDFIYETLDVYDIFKAQYYYIQNIKTGYWSTPIMVKGNYQEFLNYNAPDGIAPIIINPSYARKNNLKIGDVINIYNNYYRILGFGTSLFVNQDVNNGNFVYNPYLWMRNQDFLKLKSYLPNITRLVEDQWTIKGAFADDQLNPGFKDNKQGSWNNFANIYQNGNINLSSEPDNEINSMLLLIINKEEIIWSILMAISILLIVSSFIMISMIVNKLLLVNREIIGNLKAQGYSTTVITTLLLLCFFVLMLIISTIAMGTSWVFSFILNITYSGFLELTTYFSVPNWRIVLYDFAIPTAIVCGYAFIFIFLEVQKKPLILMKPKVVKAPIPKKGYSTKFLGFIKLNFKQKISLKFAYDAKWKLLLTIIVTTLTGAMLFTGLTTIINFSQVNLNLRYNMNWKYAYQYDNSYHYDLNNKAPYDYLVYDSPQDVISSNVAGYNILDPAQKITTSELVLKKYQLNGKAVCGPFVDGSTDLKSLKYLWLNANSYGWYVNNCKGTSHYDQITSFINSSAYYYFIEELSRNNGILTLGYQPIIYGKQQQELFALNSYLSTNFALNYGDTENSLSNYREANLKSPIDISIRSFYQNYIQPWNFSWIGGNATQFYQYENNNLLFVPRLENKTNMEWFFNEITSFDDRDSQKSLLYYALHPNQYTINSHVKEAILLTNEIKSLIQNGDWFYAHTPGWKPSDFKVNVYPIIVNKGFQFLKGVNIGDVLTSNFNEKSVTFYIVMDEFNNGMKNMILINNYATKGLAQKDLNQLYSSLEQNETYRYIGFYERNNNYAIDPSNPKTYDAAPIYNGTQNLTNMFEKTVNLQILLFLIYLLILVASIVACIFQIFIITNIIVKDNLKLLNSFKALGYSNFWIFNRMFLVYLPIIIISWVISIPIGTYVIDMIRQQIIWNMLAYVSATVNVGDYLISFFGLVAMFITAFVLNKVFMDRRYPMLKTMNWN
ncbi:FtsX-like permease family protein [Spiroplasma eriocheiris]|uniref:ABC3 transporter permease C-terminal domain-containing protein n=1 Tax=Spiroplasma eriocheiris TaxID=315358 RepID=A0A0H3XK88_9MOLU|nr:FtsX-like permease family protein [Spiroplasma eriocheiris]AHF57319.1 putative transmembrane protein [Spiroplasma eriocheiris CCTCC M 207170]AKM53779.1 hypothetical protein SERIO_v1c01860 [Spiroplasma eriocheiris]